MSEEIEALREIIANSQRIVAFTGAGISTESGIPDFRSPGGIWSRMQPIMFDDFVASEEMRRESWRRKMEIDKDFKQAEPNLGHLALAHLANTGQLSSVITQNVDGLHQRSGIVDEKVVELHGNATYATCLDCGKRFEIEPIMAAFVRDESLPVCDVCRGLVKTATISFGQAMPREPMERAEAEPLACDLFIVLGSSLVVYPAAAFPRLAKDSGASLVIINREPTEQDEIADLVIHAGIGQTLSTVVGVH